MTSFPSVAFLVSQHPAINHALLLREIRALRALGLPVQTVSIRGADRPASGLTDEERDEIANTYYVLPQGSAPIVAQIGAFFVGHPVRFLCGLSYALSLSRWNIRKAVSLLAYFAEALVIGRWMERQRLAHIHVQYSSTVGLLLVKTFPVRMSISFHGPDEFNDPEGFWLAEKIEASQFLRAISFYARSQLMKSCQARHWEKIDVAYMGVDPAAFEARSFRPAPDPFELLCVGRLAPVKAQHILIQAMAQLRQQGRRVRLHLAGGGPDKASLEQAAAALGVSDSVVVYGWVSQEQLEGLYRQADAFVLASFAEGLPGVLMEAMAMEIPCISTWITGVPELITNGVDGLLVAPSDPNGMALAVAELMDHPEKRQAIGRAGRQRILSHFHLQKNAEHLHGIFRRRLASGEDRP